MTVNEGGRTSTARSLQSAEQKGASWSFFFFLMKLSYVYTTLGNIKQQNKSCPTSLKVAIQSDSSVDV